MHLKKKWTDIWTNKQFMEYRNQILVNKSAISLCQNCQGDLDEFYYYDDDKDTKSSLLNKYFKFFIKKIFDYPIENRFN